MIRTALLALLVTTAAGCHQLSIKDDRVVVSVGRIEAPKFLSRFCVQSDGETERGKSVENPVDNYGRTLVFSVTTCFYIRVR